MKYQLVVDKNQHYWVMVQEQVGGPWLRTTDKGFRDGKTQDGTEVKGRGQAEEFFNYLVNQHDLQVLKEATVETKARPKIEVLK